MIMYHVTDIYHEYKFPETIDPFIVMPTNRYSMLHDSVWGFSSPPCKLIQKLSDKRISGINLCYVYLRVVNVDATCVGGSPVECPE